MNDEPMQDFPTESSPPYTLDEQREMRRLLIASGYEVAAWCSRLRRSADFLRSLSPAQAQIVAEQAAVIAADPFDYGEEHDLERTRRRLEKIGEEERAKHVWREIVALRRRHYPTLPEP